MEPSLSTSPAASAHRLLIVADWKADPHSVTAACLNRPETHHATVALVVPATLHGIDWIGDPYANVSCAQRALDKLTELFSAAGIHLDSATVGDHDPIGAAMDAVRAEPVEEIIVCGLNRRVRLLELGHRVSRTTELPVLSTPVPAADPTRRGWLRLRRGECIVTNPLATVPQPAAARSRA